LASESLSSVNIPSARSTLQTSRLSGTFVYTQDNTRFPCGDSLEVIIDCNGGVESGNPPPPADHATPRI
jgi:hypothetical protein